MYSRRVVALLLYYCALLAWSGKAEDDAEVVSRERTTTDSVSSNTVPEWPPASSATASVSDLHQQYYDIFHPHNNRNSAAHLWASFLLNRSTQMTPERMRLFMSGYCVVSGSPVGRPNAYNRYRLTLPLVSGTTQYEHEIHESSSKDLQLGTKSESNNSTTTTFVTGFLHYCCWPCVCDTQDFLHVDTKTIHYRNGEIQRQEYFVVMGNPCQHPQKLKEPFHQPFYGGRKTTLEQVAPAVQCLPDGTLKGATLSDSGYIILGMFLHAASSQMTNEPLPALSQAQPGRISSEHVPVQKEPSNADHAAAVELQQQDEISWERVDFHDEREWGPTCLDRANNGYNSGMGEIFRQVCAIAPIDRNNSYAANTDPLSTVE